MDRDGRQHVAWAHINMRPKPIFHAHDCSPCITVPSTPTISDRVEVLIDIHPRGR